MAARTASRLRIGQLAMAFVALATVGWQDSPPKEGKESPPPDTPKAEAPAEPTEEVGMKTLPPEMEALLPKIADIKPIPVPEVPDDPPPHEGAMIDIPYVVEPPDIVILEVLEALPGRPITGEYLVRPDGTIALDFYGDLYVRGLTTRQIKEKLILNLRTYLDDEILGLIGVSWVDVEPAAVAPPQPEGPGEPFEIPVKPGAVVAPPEPVPPGDIPPPNPPTPRQAAPPRPRNSKPTSAVGRGHIRLVRSQKAAPKRPEPLKQPKRPARVVPEPDSKPAEKPAERRPPEDAAVRPGRVPVDILIPPANSDRVYVDIASYNHNVYYVQGDVAAPGRLPTTGNETVLDALNNVGGLIPTADETDIRLVRPGRGGKPGKVYKVDLAAIQEKGDPRTNYQVFPNDRIFVGRHPVVRATLEADRQYATSNALLSSLLTYAYAVRSINNIHQPYTPGANSEPRMKLGDKNTPIEPGPSIRPLSPEEREAILRAWAEFHRAIVNRPEGAPLDAELLRKGLLHTPLPTPTNPPGAKDKPSK